MKKGKKEVSLYIKRIKFFNLCLTNNAISLVSHLRMSHLKLDQQTANVEVLKWLRDVANRRTHGTTGEVPLERLKEEQVFLQELPSPYYGDIKAARALVSQAKSTVSLCDKPLQRPLAVYQQILEAL